LNYEAALLRQEQDFQQRLAERDSKIGKLEESLM